MINMPVSPRKLFHIVIVLVFLLLVLSACGGAAPAYEPEPTAPASTEAPSEEEPSAPEVVSPTLIPPQTTPVTSVPAIPERRRLTLEFPEKIRVGDSDVARLTLEVDDLGNVTPTAQFGGNVVTGEVVEIPNLYETHNVIAEAKFDIAGLQISPPELVSQTLSKGQTVNFYWSVRPADPGNYRGTIWFYLRYVDKVSGEESRKTVSAQIVEIESVNILGLPANLVRTTGGIGSVVGAIVGFPFFEDVVKFIFGKKGSRKNKNMTKIT